MRLIPLWATATLPKAGHKPDENEDATAVNAAALRFAVADGATEGWQSRGWADRLAAAFVRRPPTPADFTRWLADLRESWSPPPAPDSWYAEIKQEQGSFATLAGLAFFRVKGRAGLRWKAVAVGDSCLFLVRGGKVEIAFPVSDPAEFGSSPALVPSATSAVCPTPEWLAGRVEPGDLFVLVTDAAAAFLLRSTDPPWADFHHPRPKRMLEYLSEWQRMQNDDLSAIAVAFPGPAESPR